MVNYNSRILVHIVKNLSVKIQKITESLKLYKISMKRIPTRSHFLVVIAANSAVLTDMAH